MKQILNGFKPYYYLDEDGQVYNSNQKKYVKKVSSRSYRLRTEENQSKNITLKSLYKLVYNEDYCLDEIPDLENEEWRKIEYSKNSYISNKGRVKSKLQYNAVLRKPENRHGYLRVNVVYADGSIRVKTIARLVAEAFLTAPTNPEEYQIHHIDCNSLNNEAENLMWISQKDHVELHKKIRQERLLQSNGNK